MHGIIFAELKKYVEARHGNDTWNTLLKEAGLGAKMYTLLNAYPDEETLALVSTASRLTSKPVPVILEDFGEFIVPDLVSLYKAFVTPEWKTLEFIEHTEQTIHRVVRLKSPGAKPPELKVTRVGPNELLLVYGSARKMCSVAKGISKGVAKHFGEKILLTETACIAKGAPECRISIKKI